jgi:hypothetical protein
MNYLKLFYCFLDEIIPDNFQAISMQYGIGKLFGGTIPFSLQENKKER